MNTLYIDVNEYLINDRLSRDEVSSALSGAKLPNDAAGTSSALRYALAPAVSALRNGGLCAFPTETVYGLGGDAKDPEASKKIYAAKGRPSDNPLIVHIYDFSQMEEIAEDIPEAAKKLSDAFWPGPLTIVVRKNDVIPHETTGGLDTVAVRMPSHPVAAALLRESNVMIAAPSANLSGRPSPTEAAHVKEDMDGRIDCIIDGGPVQIGLESTIVDLTGDVPMILRPGYVTKEDLERVLGCEVLTDPGLKTGERPKAPGMKYRHYAPKGELLVFEANHANRGERLSVSPRIAEEIEKRKAEAEASGLKVKVIKFSEYESEEAIAADLYRLLRECDDEGADLILAEKPKTDRLTDAIMNRLLKAAGVKECIRV